MHSLFLPLEMEKNLRQLVLTACLLSRGNEVQMGANRTWGFVYSGRQRPEKNGGF